MDIERKIRLIARAPTEEILTMDELRALLETKEHPVAYGGWEPSGLVHLGTGLLCAYKMKDLIEAGVKFKAYLATWHAWINNKMGGDIALIKKAAEHFKHAWLSLGVPEKKIEFIYADEVYDNLDYWQKMILVAKNLTLARARRTLEVAGRKEAEANYVSDFIYTPMQVADVFQFDVDICQLGMDQRKANVVAREVGEKLSATEVIVKSGNMLMKQKIGMAQNMGLKFWKPVCVHHHLLQGLVKPPVWPIQEGQEKEMLTSIKMSKSKPETCVFIYDSPEDIKRKIGNAFCPEKTINYNPIIDICRHIIFRETDSLEILRPAKFGGNLEVCGFDELAKIYGEGKLHPMDLKNAVAEELTKILEPVRAYFEKNGEAKELLETIRKANVTR
ncbi:MAG: tyrosine--tRNA ligase [Nanoarchaeota archaeon]|nr:tyrosine--tRNA ligase [Nanoarchaeota archaeon]